MTAPHILFAHWPAFRPSSEVYQMIRDVSQPDDSLIFYHALPYAYLADNRRPQHTQKMLFGADNMMPADPESYSEHFAAHMVKEAHGDFVLLGDAERREMFDETDEMIRHKVLHATSHSLTTMLSIRDPSQLSVDLEGLTPEQLSKVMIVYQGPWAGFYRDAGLAQEMADAAIQARSVLHELLGDDGTSISLLLALPSRLKDAQEIVKHTFELCNGYYLPKAVIWPHTLTEMAHAICQWQPAPPADLSQVDEESNPTL